MVFRNSLMELLQYAPTTRTTYETPILQPALDQYYVMDLSPGRSFIQWAVDHGHTVLAISYRNPDESMRGSSWTTTCSRGRSLSRRGPRHHRRPPGQRGRAVPRGTLTTC